MPALMKGRSRKAGLPLGSFVHIGKRKKGDVHVTVIEYNEREFRRRAVTTGAECADLRVIPNLKLNRSLAIFLDQFTGYAIGQVAKYYAVGKIRIRCN
jgi:hypothetical protein